MATIRRNLARLIARRKIDVEVRPAIPEWEERPRDYEELLDALNARGVNAKFTDHKGIPSGSDIPALVPEAFAVFVLTKATDALIGSLVNDLARIIVSRAKAKWWRKGEQVKGVIYGPNNEVLRELTFEPAEGSTDDP